MDEIEREMFAFFIVLSQFLMVFVLPLVWATEGLRTAVILYVLTTLAVIAIPLLVRFIECVVFTSVAITVALLELFDNG